MKNLPFFFLCFFVGLQIIADISSLRILVLMGLSIDGGTLVYPLVFTLRDVIHRSFGKSVTQTVVISCGIINIFMIAVFAAVAYLPPDLSVGTQEEFGKLLYPAFQIVLASVLAEVVSGLIDGNIYQKWYNKFSNRYIAGRVVFSNLFSIIVDSMIFCSIAFWGLPFEVVFSIFLSNLWVKYAVSLLSIPLIYFVDEK